MIDDLHASGGPGGGMVDDLGPSLYERGKDVAGRVFNQIPGAQSAVAFGKALLPTTEQLPEVGGMMAGEGAATSAIAAGANPLYTVPAMALGAATGDTVKKYIDLGRLAFGSNPQDVHLPQTMGEAANDYGWAALRGGTGGLINRGMQKVLTPFAGGVTPEIAQQAQAAARIGVKPPLRTMTENPAVQGMERHAEYSMFGTPITNRTKAAVQGLENYADMVSKGMGPNVPPEYMAQMADKKLSGFEAALDKTKDAIYDAAWPQIRGLKPQLTNTIQTIEGIIAKRSGELEPPQLGMLKSLLNRIKEAPAQVVKRMEGIPGMGAKEVSETLPGKKSSIATVEFLRNTKTNIGQMLKEGFNDPGLTGIKTDLRSVYGAIVKDIDTTVQPVVGDGLRKAEAVFASNLHKLKAPIVKAIQKRAETNPSQLFDVIIRKENPTLIKAGKEILGEDGFAQVRKQWFDDLLTNSKVDMEGSRVTNPRKLAHNLEEYAKGGVLEEIVAGDKPLAQAIADIMDVSRMMGRGQKVTQGSQTAYIAGKIKGVLGALSAPLVRSDTGREFLTTGFPSLGRALGAAGAVEGERGMMAVADYKKNKK